MGLYSDHFYTVRASAIFKIGSLLILIFFWKGYMRVIQNIPEKWRLEVSENFYFFEKDIWGSSKIFLMTLLFRYGLKMIEKGEFHKKKIYIPLWNKVYMKKWLLEGHLFFIFLEKDIWGSPKIFLMTLLFRYGLKMIEKGEFHKK